MSNKISRFLDYLFARCLAALIIFIWIKYYAKSWSLSILYTAIVMAVLIIVFDIIFKKDKPKESATDKAKKEQIMNQLCLNTAAQNLEFFGKLLSIQYDVTAQKSCLIIKKDNLNMAVFLKFSTSKLAPNNIIDAIKDSKEFYAKKILILCNGANANAYSFAACIDGVQITILDDNAVYELMKRYNMYPEINLKINKFPKSLKLKELAAIALSRKRVKGYFLGSLLLLFSSFFVRYYIYYRIAATIMMIMALVAMKDFKFVQEKEKLL
ncbi:MAG: hypothetical protein GX756_04945 [Clostridiales bacterium]|nr:hypothetical protein [Clostridiales bacterium]